MQTTTSDVTPQSPQKDVIRLYNNLRSVHKYLKIRLGTSQKTGELNLVYLVKFNPNTSEEKEAFKSNRDMIRDLFKRLDLGSPLGIDDIPILNDLRESLVMEKPIWTASSWAGGTPVSPAIFLNDLTSDEIRLNRDAASTKEKVIRYIDQMIQYLENLPSTIDQSLSINDIPLIEKALRTEKSNKIVKDSLNELSKNIATFFNVTGYGGTKYINGMNLFFPYSKHSTFIEEYNKLVTKCSVQNCGSEDLKTLFRHTDYLEMAISGYDPAIQGISQLVYSEEKSQTQVEFIVKLIKEVQNFRSILLRSLFDDEELRQKLEFLQNKRKMNIDKIKELIGKEEIWVLSLDGGGIRGLLASMVLDDLSQKIGKSIPDAFDFFAGTSIGGLICLGLNTPSLSDPSRPQYNAQYIARLLKDNGKIIFPDITAKQIKQAWGHLYDPTPLEDLLRRNFGNKMISESIKPTLVTAVDITNSSPTFFGSYKTEAKTGAMIAQWQFRPEQNIRIWEAGRSTSAATTYFPRKVVYHNGTLREMIDGGITTNNPTLLALQEIRDLCKSLTPNCKVRKINIVSIGTGKMQVERPFGLSQAGIQNIIHDFTVIGMNFGSQQADKGVKEALEFQRYDMRHPAEYTYYRFNPILDEPIDLDSAEPSNITKLELKADKIKKSQEFAVLTKHLLGQKPGQDGNPFEFERVPELIKNEQGNVVVDEFGNPKFTIVEQPKRIFNME